MSDSNTFETLLGEARTFVRPLSDLLANLAGPARDEAIEILAQRLAIPADRARALSNAIGSTLSSLEATLLRLTQPGADPGAVAAQAETQLRAFFASISQLSSGLDAGLTARRLVEFLAAEYVVRKAPKAASLMKLLGVLKTEKDDSSTPAKYWRRLDLDAIPTLLSDPKQKLVSVVQWGLAQFDPNDLLEPIQDIAYALGAESYWHDFAEPSAGATPPALWGLVIPFFSRFDRGAGGALVFAEAGLRIKPVPALAPPPQDIPGAGYARGQGPGIAFVPFASAGIGANVDIIPDQLALVFGGRLDAQGGIALVVRNGSIEIIPPGQATVVEGSVHLGVESRRASGQRVILFKSDLGELSYQRLAAVAGADLRAGPSGTTQDLFAELALQGARMALKPDPEDGLLTTLLGADGIQLDFDLALGWSSLKGIYFRGSSDLTWRSPLQIRLPGLEIEEGFLTLAPISSPQAGFAFAAGGSLVAKLGPVRATVKDVGFSATISRSASGGNLGFAQLTPSVKLPSGGGLSIDIPNVITGGGFLRYEEGPGRYLGLAALRLAGGTQIQGAVILDTKLPSGPGYSLVASLAAKFASGVPLGFGFFLKGVGGMVGINRTLNVDAIRAGVRTGAIDAALFPDRPLERADAVLAALQTFFPPAPGRFVFGPMVELEWSQPALISARLAILLELPEPVRVALLGVLSAQLPSKDNAVANLNLDIAGIADFGRGELSLDGTLRDSTLAGFKLSGDLALRMRWADSPQFAVSVGGFHPRFQPPPGFPSLRRLSIAADFGGNPRLQLDAYLALTSNTAQFGAGVSLWAEAFGFSLDAKATFDALIQLVPFGFATDFSASVAVRYGSTQLAGAYLQATITGPGPFRVKGSAAVSVAFFEEAVAIDVTFGEGRDTSPETVDLAARMGDAVKEPANWGAVPELEPSGPLEWRQKLAPLEATLDRCGAANLVGGQERLRVASVSIAGAASAPSEATRDLFSPAQFYRMSDSEKLSSPGFSPMVSGFRAYGGTWACPANGRSVPLVCRPTAMRGGDLGASQGDQGVGASSAQALAPTAVASPAPTAIEANADAYLVARRANLEPRLEISPLGPLPEVRRRLETHLAANPSDRPELVIIGRHECPPNYPLP